MKHGELKTDCDKREYLLLNGAWNVRLCVNFFDGGETAYWYYTLTIHDGHVIQIGLNCELKDDAIIDGLKMWESFKSDISGIDSPAEHTEKVAKLVEACRKDIEISCDGCEGDCEHCEIRDIENALAAVEKGE